MYFRKVRREVEIASKSGGVGKYLSSTVTERIFLVRVKP
jgi:hypothetical protein